jgi:hypothetical protein
MISSPVAGRSLPSAKCAISEMVDVFIGESSSFLRGRDCPSERAARGSAAVRARRSRLAEHGAKRRADGLDGENRVRSWNLRAIPSSNLLHIAQSATVKTDLTEQPIANPLAIDATKKGKERPS